VVRLSSLLKDVDLQTMERLLMRRYGSRLRPGEWIQVSHTRDQETESLIMDVVDGGEHFRFEAQLHLEDVKDAEMSTDILMDFLDAVLDEWFDGGREAYPTLDFSPYEFTARTWKPPRMHCWKQTQSSTSQTPTSNDGSLPLSVAHLGQVAGIPDRVLNPWVQRAHRPPVHNDGLRCRPLWGGWQGHQRNLDGVMGHGCPSGRHSSRCT